MSIHGKAQLGIFICLAGLFFSFPLFLSHPILGFLFFVPSVFFLIGCCIILNDTSNEPKYHPEPKEIVVNHVHEHYHVNSVVEGIETTIEEPSGNRKVTRHFVKWS